VPTKKVLKIAGLNIGIALVDTIIFSPGLLGITMGGTSIFATAFGATVALMSVAVFATGNYTLITEREKIIQVSEIKTVEEYINALKQNYRKRTFEKDIDTILGQIESFQSKKEAIKDILLQKFNSAEMSYTKFSKTISGVEEVLYINIKSILNKLSAFDEVDYKRIQKNDAEKKFSKEFIQSKMNIYNEYISFVKAATEENEQIIFKLDKLLLEISKFNSIEDSEIGNLSGMQEIDELISQTKLYK
jgi:hypothetical protein